jgi:site-specific DNA recombinase
MLPELAGCKTAVCYYRYSSDKDAQVLNSEQRQRAEMERFCHQNELRVVWNGGDEATSGDKDKPQLQHLEKEIREKQIVTDCLVVYSWDRLTRKDILNFSDDVKWISDAGLKLVLVSQNRVFDMTSGHDTMILGMMVSEANQYLKNLSRNVRSGLAAKFNNGTLGYARAPFGYDKGDNKQLVPNEDLPLVKEIFETALSDGIVSAVNVMAGSKRYKNKQKPTTTAVRHVLRNSIYIGIRTFGVAGTGRHGTIRDEVTRGTRNVDTRDNSALEPQDVSDLVPPVIDDSLFNRVQDMLEDNKRRQPKRSNTKYKYSGLMRCSCGAKLVAEKRHTLIKYTCPYSKSKKQARCNEPLGRKNITEEMADDLFGELSKLITKDMSFHKQVFSSMMSHVERKMKGQSNEAEQKLQERERKVKAKSRIFSIMAKTADRASDEQMEVLSNQVEKLDLEIEDIDGSIDKADVELSELLVSKFTDDIEAVMGDTLTTGQYINGMMQAARGLASEAMPKREAAKHVREIVNAWKHAKHDGYDLKDMVDEVNIEWKESQDSSTRYRIVPKRIVATWKVSSVTTELVDLVEPRQPNESEADYKARVRKVGLFTEALSWVKRGVKNSLSAQIILYPSSGRYYLRMERV